MFLIMTLEELYRGQPYIANDDVTVDSASACEPSGHTAKSVHVAFKAAVSMENIETSIRPTPVLTRIATVVILSKLCSLNHRIRAKKRLPTL